MTIFSYALRRMFRNRMNAFFFTLAPIGCIFFPEGGEWPFLPYGFQYFGIVILFSGIRLASLILEDREKGVVKRLAVAPVSHFQYLSQNLLASSIVLILQCVIVVAGGMLLGKELYQPFLLLLLYITFSFASLAIALAWISLYRKKEISFIIYSSFIFILVVLGGLMIPIQMFPELLKRLAAILPTYWLAAGQDWIVFGGAWSDYVLTLGVLWLYAILFVVIGSARKLQ